MPTSGDEWSNSYTLTWIKGSWASEVFSFGMYCFSRSLLQLMKELSSGKRSLNNGNACSKDKNSARSGALFLLLTPVISSVILSSSHSVSGWDSSRNTNSLDLAGKRKEWIILAIRLCDRNLSEDLQRNLERQWQEGKPKQYPAKFITGAISPQKSHFHRPRGAQQNGK